MKIMMELTRDEIRARIPYALICETRDGARWGTSRRRRRWAEEFTEQEKSASTRLFSLAHQWYLVKGVPDKVVMSAGTLALWEKLGAFCGSL